MAFNRFTKNVLNVSGLPDRVQNQAPTLKATFDKAGVDIKEALNRLISELEAVTSASNIGADVSSVTTKTVQAILTAFELEIAERYTKNEVDTLVSGNTNDLVADVDVNLSTGVITVTKKDGAVEKFDTALEKVPAKFEIVENGTSLFLKITNVDGTSTQTNITELMNIYDFSNTNDIAFNVTGTGNEKVVTASIRSNSIGLDKLSLSVVSTLEGYMTSARDSASAAKTSETNARNSANIATKAAETASIAEGLAETAIEKATEAESYAHGGTGSREGEDTDNAKYYSQVAKEVAGGDFVTPTEMEAYAQKKGTAPSFEGEVLGGEVIETELPLELESILHISGNSEQNSRSGKNLFDVEDGTINNCTKNISGNSITLTSTQATGGFSAYVCEFPAKPNTKYYLQSKSTRTGNGGGGIIVQVRKSDNTTSNNLINKRNELNAGGVFTTPSDTVNIRVYLYACGDTGTETATQSATFTDVQIEEGTVATPYEPYGVQPSPDYPSEIRSVKSKSDNLFDSDDALVTKGGFAKLEDGSYYRNSVTAKSGVWVNEEGYAGQITIRGELKWVNYSTYAGEIVEFEYTDGTKVTIKEKNSEYKDKWGIFEGVSDSTKVLKQINLSYGGASENYFRNIMLNKGTEALPYQPYGYVPVEVKVEGKNMLDISFAKPQYTINIDTGELKASSTNGCGENYIKVSPNTTYTFSAKEQIGELRLSEYASDFSYIQRTSKGDTASFTITTTENTHYLRWSLHYKINVNIQMHMLESYNLQLEEGSIATPYVPYQTKTISLPLGDIQLRSTPDGTRDTFERVDGVWNKVNNIGSVVFDGNADENWEYMYECFRIRYDCKGTKNQDNIEYILMSDKYKVSSQRTMQGSSGTIDYGIASRVEGNNGFIIKNKDITTVENWKTWLSNNPTQVDYILATPTYTPITDTALIQALDELENLILHKGYTRITVTSVNSVKAYLDLSIPATALVTNITETEATSDMIIPVVESEGNVLVKIPAENRMTLNPSTGVAKINREKIATIQSFSAIIPTAGWSGTSPYYIDIPVQGLKATDKPHYGLAYSNVGVTEADKTARENEQLAFNDITTMIANDNSLRVICDNRVPLTQITVQLEVIR